MAIRLEKVIEPGSLRAIGSLRRGVEPQKLPIGCRSIEDILEQCSGSAFTLGRFRASNAFVWVMKECPYHFVRPDYTGYRRLAHLRFPLIPADHDVDHVLARAIAKKLELRYVLVSIVPSSINRSHGWVEKIGRSLVAEPRAVCFSDERIFHKVLRRMSIVRQTRKELLRGYDPAYSLQLGLTLKQSGLWNLSMGFDQEPSSMFLAMLNPYTRATDAEQFAVPEDPASAALPLS